MEVYSIVFKNEKIQPKVFRSKRDCWNFLLDGLYATEGAESEHYLSMMKQLESGCKTLVY